MAKDKRVEVLFEPSDYERLQEVAELEGRPVGGVIREAVARYISGPSPERRHQAFVWLTSQDHGQMPNWEDLKDALGRSRTDAILKGMDVDEAWLEG